MRKLAMFTIFACACMIAAYARGQEMKTPERVVANTAATIATSGSGSATFYLFGPSSALKKSVKLGEEIALAPEHLRASGRYTAVLRSGSSSTTRDFFVSPAA